MDFESRTPGDKHKLELFGSEERIQFMLANAPVAVALLSGPEMIIEAASSEM